MVKTLLPLIALLVACESRPPMITPTPAKVCDKWMDLEVDSLFTILERTEILKAISDWRAASSDRICFQITWWDTSKDERTFRFDGRFVIYSWRRSWQIRAATSIDRSPCPTRNICLGVTIWEHDVRASDVFVFTKKLEYLRAIATHELGHVFGLKHTGVYDSIMYETVRQDKTIGGIDRKNLACLLKTRWFLNPRNDCTYTR